MLNKDPKLPFLSMAWSRSKAADFFNQHVLPAAGRSAEVTEVGIEDMTYFPGRKCDILYSLEFTGPTGADSNLAVATFAKDDRLEEPYRRHYTATPDATSPAAPVAAVYLPEYHCLVEFFPSDWELPSLAAAMDAEAFTRLLPQVEAQDGWDSSRRVLATQALRYRPHLRCVLQFVLQSRDGQDPQKVIGKLYPQGPKLEQAWSALQRFPKQAPPGVVIPKPLGRISDANLILMECVSGRSMKRILEEATARDQVEKPVRQAAATLATLHRFQFESQEVRSLEGQLEQLRSLDARLHMVAPSLAERIDSLVEQIATLGRLCRVETPCFVHGDFKPSQLLIDGEQVAVVDFDKACLGDPAVDVGNFMAALHKAALDGQDYLRDLAGAFLAEYQKRLPQAGLADRARLFQIAALVRMAIRSFKRSPYAYGRDGTDSQAVRVLQEAAACLASL